MIRRMTALNGAQTLLIDADDTLWENNIYFERAIGRFISFLNHRDYTPEQVRLILNDVERDSIIQHGINNVPANSQFSERFVSANDGKQFRTIGEMLIKIF